MPSSAWKKYFFNDTATTEIYTLSLYDALPISLANISCMEELGIEIGHKVIITKAGMIIPKILKDLTTGKFVEGYTF